jgi:broad specificity phosphatase PhoE
MRNIPDQHLNQDGVTLVREVGERSGSFQRVITSTIPRAFETAIAMGYAVDETIGFLGTIEDGVEEEISWDAGFSEFSKEYAKDGVFANWCNNLAKFQQKLINNLPDGSRILIISHGGIVEASAVGLLPEFDFSNWNHSISYCEGIKITYEFESFTSIEFLTVGR